MKNRELCLQKKLNSRDRNLQLPEDPEELYEIDRDMEATLETEFLPHRDFYQ